MMSQHVMAISEHRQRASDSQTLKPMRNEGLILGHSPLIEVGSENFIA
jgi:hypothetical protein